MQSVAIVATAVDAVDAVTTVFINISTLICAHK